MSTRAAVAAAGFIFTTIIPTVVGAMIPDLAFGAGVAIIIASAIPGLALLAYSLWGGKSARVPKPHWITLHAAPFLLAPHKRYWSQTNFWTPVLLKYSLPGEEPVGFTIKNRLTQEQAKTRSGLPLDQSKILCQQQKFEWTWNGDGDHFMLKRHPWDMQAGGCPDWLEPKTWDAISEQSQMTWDLMGRGLSELVSKGVVRLWGRMGSSTAEFTPLPASAWAHFTVEDWKHGRAKGSGSDYLFDIHIEPADLTIPPDED